MTSRTAPSSTRAPVLAALALVVSSLVVVSGARLAGYSPRQDLGPAEVVQSRLISFEDSANGSVTVRDAGTGQIIAIAAPGTNGFLRGTLRGLMRVRKTDEASLVAPFRLDRLSNGQLILTDLTKDLKLDLNAYGQTNAEVFAAFLSTTGDKS